jgi:large subunit ribosomal protein L24
MKIKTGDNVRVIAGKDKGKEGKVLQVFPKVQRVVVDGVNKLTKHLKRAGNRPGQKIEFSAPLHISNVKLVSSKSGASGRVGYKVVEKDGKKSKIRVIRSKGNVEDIE